MRPIYNRHLSNVETEVIGHSADVVDSTLLLILNDVDSTLRI